MASSKNMLPLVVSQKELHPIQHFSQEKNKITQRNITGVGFIFHWYPLTYNHRISFQIINISEESQQFQYPQKHVEISQERSQPSNECHNRIISPVYRYNTQICKLQLGKSRKLHMIL